MIISQIQPKRGELGDLEAQLLKLMEAIDTKQAEIKAKENELATVAAAESQAFLTQ